MDGIHDLALFIGAGLLLNLTPGPDMLLVATRASTQGWRAGMWASLGIGLGCLLHVGLAALGLTAVLAASETAYTVLKLIGAAYLFWIGIQLLWPRQSAGVQPQVAPAKASSPFWQGVWTNALNPKVALFFLAFLPQFIDMSAPGHSLGLLLLGALFTLNGLLVNLGVALCGVALARRLSGAPKLGWLRAHLTRCVGVLFVGLGLRLALSNR